MVPGGRARAGGKALVRVARGAERRPSLLTFAAKHARSYPGGAGTENRLGSLLFPPPQTQLLGEEQGAATSLPAPALQKQNRNKHSVMPHLLRMAAA